MNASEPAVKSAQAELILEAAARIFAERGFPGASMADLAQDCGISKALVYHYYAGKEALLFDMTERYMARLVDLCAEVEVQKLDPKAHLRALIRAFLDAYQSSQARHMVLVHDAKFLEPARRKIIVARQRQVIDAFRRAIAAASGGRLAFESTLPAAMLVFGMINWTFTWLKGSGPMSYADFAEWAIAMIEGGITNLPPASAAKTNRLSSRRTPGPSAGSRPRIKSGAGRATG